MSRSIDFFEQQFRLQAERAEYALNPFERAILPYLSGKVLDLGSGLGNLALAATQAGCAVTALDGSSSGVADLARRAAEADAQIDAQIADLRHFVASRPFDCVVAIGLLMFFPCSEARAVLAQIRRAVRPGGIAAVNVLVVGTTYMAMFDPDGYYLFGRDELSEAFKAWDTILSVHEDFPAAGGALKRFHTIVARRPVD
jgi:tellurite methyltransferase